jgi:hypothetical protein
MSEESWLAKMTVKSVLNNSNTAKIKSFSFMGIGFDPKTFPLLAGFVDRDQIKVEYDSTKSSRAEYDYSSNTIILGFRAFLDYSQTALLLHECVHAVYDVAGKKMSVAISESVAYIVQCQYIYANAGPGKRLSHKEPAKDLVFKLAWGIAAKIQEGKAIEPLDKTNLIAAVSAHPFYAKEATSDAGFNGV